MNTHLFCEKIFRQSARLVERTISAATISSRKNSRSTGLPSRYSSPPSVAVPPLNHEVTGRDPRIAAQSVGIHNANETGPYSFLSRLISQRLNRANAAS